MRPASTSRIRLTAEKRGNLQDIARFGGEGGLGGLVDVGEDGESGVVDGFEDAESFFEAGATVGGDAGAIGFVEGGFKDERALRIS